MFWSCWFEFSGDYYNNLPHVPSVMEEAQIAQFLPLTPHVSMSLSRYTHTRLSYIKFWAMGELLFMANDYYWAVIGETTDGARVYGAGDWYVANYQPKTLANTWMLVHTSDAVVGHRLYLSRSSASQRMRRERLQIHFSRLWICYQMVQIIPNSLPHLTTQPYRC